MSGRVEGKVALVTGGARGQGRSHAIRLAEEGADIIVVDICKQISSVTYQMSSRADLETTVKEVESRGRRVVSAEVDVRDFDALDAFLDGAVAHFGALDIACVNAGIASYGRLIDLSPASWADVIDTNLTGAWYTAKAAATRMVGSGCGGSIIFTSSVAGLKGMENMGHYAASKHGVIGLARSLALELAPHFIRVNCVCPSLVNTDQVQNESTYRLFRPDLESPTQDDAIEAFLSIDALPICWLEPVDISNAVLFLASDEARYITGVALPVDAGAFAK